MAVWTEEEIEDGWPFYEIHFPNCQPLICPRDEIWDFISESLEYLEPGEADDVITIKACNLTKEQLLEIEEHQGC